MKTMPCKSIWLDSRDVSWISRCFVPGGHQVVCRRCFVKTIQSAVSQRLLPLRCVICRARISRLTSSSGTWRLQESASSYSVGSKSWSVRVSNQLTEQKVHLDARRSPAQQVPTVSALTHTLWARRSRSQRVCIRWVQVRLVHQVGWAWKRNFSMLILPNPRRLLKRLGTVSLIKRVFLIIKRCR